MALAGKRIVVTGGAGVLGQGVARVAQSQGADVILLDVTPSSPDLIGELIQVDLADSASLHSSFEQLGDFDVLANIAGGFAMGPAVYETEDQLWDAMFNLNVTTLRRVLNEAVPRLLAKGRGSVINVGAMGALRDLLLLLGFLLSF